MKKSELKKFIKESVKKLIAEQYTPGIPPGSHGLQITNVAEPNPYAPQVNLSPYINLFNQVWCHTPILRTCNHDSNNNPWRANQACRHYIVSDHNATIAQYGLHVLNNPKTIEVGCIARWNWGTGTFGAPLQIGDCFSWDENNKVECIVGFSATKGLSISKELITCNECGQDSNNNNIDDCIDCNNLTFTGDIPGCLDCPNCPNYAANLTPPATVDDGSCLGCTDSTSPNYEPNADIDDGSCNIDPNNIPGCTDPTAQNYDPNATVDDGSCIATVYGCTDPVALNYYAGAQVDDGSCIYPGDPSGSIDPRDPRDPKDPPIEDPTDKPNKEVCCDWCATVVPDVPSIPPPGCEDWNCDFCDPTRDPSGENPDDPSNDPNLGENFIYRLQKLANIKK